MAASSMTQLCLLALWQNVGGLMTMFMVSKYRGMISLSKYSCPYYVLTTFSVRFFAMKIAYFDLFTIFFRDIQSGWCLYF